MNRKGKELLVMLILVTFMISGCATKKPLYEYPISSYDYPLSSGDIEEALTIEGLSWNIIKTDVFLEGQKIHTLKNQNNKYISVVNSYITDSTKIFELSFFPINIKGPIGMKFPPNTVFRESSSEAVGEEQWIKMFKLAGALYGEEYNYKKIHKELNTYCLERSSEKYGPIYWTKRIDDIHIEVKMSPLEENEGYQLISFKMINAEGYEEYKRDWMKRWESLVLRESNEVMKNTKVADITPTKESDKIFSGLITKGRLEKFKNIKQKDLTAKHLNTEIILYEKDFFSADLVDETGRRRVIVRKSSLEKEELRESRIHYISYYDADDICVIEFSVIDTREEENW